MRSESDDVALAHDIGSLLAASRLAASSLLRRRPGATPEVRRLFRW